MAFEPKQFGKYLLIEKLATGGMAEIYKAKTYGVDGFEKELAIKRILPHCSADKDFITMLTDEAKLSVLLSHANIVQVYDLGRVGDDYYISMEFIHGPNLRDLLAKCREAKIRMPADIAVFIASEICKGLDYAHRKTDQMNRPLGLVHRDVSPQNILISYEGEVKIVDFGIAKAAMNISHTMAGILKGKIAYMSPEQAMGKTVDKRTDVFSAGILLYEMLSGTKLFTGDSQFEVLKKIRASRVAEDILPDSIPERLRPIVAKALAFHVHERYQSAGDLQIDLTKFLYSSFNDFSPRKLSAFIREIFANEMAIDEDLRIKEAEMEMKTGTMNLDEGARQMEIVRRGDTSPVLKGTDTAIKPLSEPKFASQSPTESKTLKKRRRRKLKLAIALAGVALLAGIGFAAYKYLPEYMAGKGAEKPVPVTEPVIAEKFGSAKIASNPAGAKIFIAGTDTGKQTPATIEGLKVGGAYALKLERQGFAPAEQALTITSEAPVDVNLTLVKNSGTIDVITDPVGAAISVNGRLTGLATPATIEDLPLNEDHKITLSKPDYEDFEQVVKLTSTAKQRLMAKLQPLAQAQPPPPEPEAKTAGPAKAPKTQKPVTTEPAKPLPVKAQPPAKPAEPPPPPPVEPEAPSVKPPEPEKAEVQGMGKIKIASDPPGADVYVNSELKGKTPITVTAPAGTASVLVGKEGLTRYSQRVEVKAGETVSLTGIRLSDMYGDVGVSTNPAGAQVVFDGQTIPARTPVTIRKVRADRPHTISITLEGYKPWSSSFNMEGEKKKSFNVNLERE